MNTTKKFTLLLVTLILATSALVPARAGSVLRQYYEYASTASDPASVQNGVIGLRNYTNIYSGGTFPFGATFAEQIDDFTTNYLGVVVKGLQGRDNSRTHYGTYIHGYIEAPASGSYTFYLASDDNSELWLSTNHVKTNIVLIAYENGSGEEVFTGARLNQRRSVPVQLQKAQRYYFEVLHKQGGGAAYVKVGWERPNGVKELIPALHLVQDHVDEYGQRYGTFYDTLPPEFNFYGFNDGNLPPSVSIAEHDVLQLETDVIAPQPTTYQWFFNGNALPGENLSFLRFEDASAIYNGSFYVVITNAYGAITSATTVVSISADTTSPSVEQVDHRGNPNSLRVIFSEKVSAATATALTNYALRTSTGTAIPVSSAVLLADQKSVQLSGSFGFLLGSNYVLTVSNVLDTAASPNLLSPNPSVLPFSYVPSAGLAYNFNSTSTNGFSLFGAAALRDSGSHDGSGYVKLTDAVGGQSGALLFTDRRTIDQLRLRFKARLADASATPGEGFSVNIAGDLPGGTFARAEEGYLPLSTAGADRLIVSFDNFQNETGDLSPSISVKWRGVVLTNVLTGAGGIPALNNAGAWRDVDVNLRRGGKLSVSYAGVTVFTNLSTGIDAIANAQIGFAAATGTNSNYETHWFDDINLNFIDGEIGAVTLAGGDLSNVTVFENSAFSLSVVPGGASPFTYQWYRAGVLLPGETNRLLNLIATNGANTTYTVGVTNEFTGTISATGTVTVQPDLTAPRLVLARGFAGSLSQVRLTFDEPLDPITATNSATYDIVGLPVLNVALSADGRTVSIDTSNVKPNLLYVFKVAGLKDRAVAGNTLTTTGTFVSEVNYFGEVLADSPVRYYRFNETSGTTIRTVATGVDTLSSGNGEVTGSFQLGVGSLVPNLPDDGAIRFSGGAAQRVLVPNGNDLNVGGPYDRKSYEVWFNADSVPAPGTTGLGASAGIWEQGAGSRNIALYLYRNPDNEDPNTVSLVIHAFNDAADGAGAPYGRTTQPAVYAEYPGIQVGQTYHVVATLDGKTNATAGRFDGQLALFVNGVEVARTNGVGRTYNHGGDVQLARGNGLLHEGGSGDYGPFLGTLDEISAYNTVLSPARIASHYAAGIAAGQSGVGTLAANRVDTRGNPNQVLVTFSGVLSPVSATNLANYTLKKADGTIIPILSASLLGGDRTVSLNGNFGLLVNSNYVLIVYDVAGPSGSLVPNPTNLPFSFVPPTATTYDFNLGLPAGFLAYGNATVTNAGGSDGSGFLKLTEAAASQNGAVILTERRDIDQVRLRFKARISDASATPADGFAVTIASDLPAATYTTPEEGYLPAASPTVDRFIVAFDNFNSGASDTAPSIAVKWRGVVLTNVLTGVGGVPALNNTSGSWTNVDINLKRGGKLSVVYGNVIVVTNFATGIDLIANAQIGLGARTGTSFETHWFDDLSVNYNDGEIGTVGIGSDSELASRNVSENTLVRFSVVPTGSGPFTYRWYRNGSPVTGGTARVLNVVAGLGEAGNYTVAVSNEFSGVISSAATLSVFIDNTPAAVSQLRFINGTLGIIRATFSEPVLPSIATNLATYSVNGLILSNVVLSADGQTITIKTSPQTLGQNYTLQITGLKDLSSTGNPFSGQAQAVSAYSYVDEVLLDLPSRYWRFDETSGSSAVSLTSELDPIGTAVATYVNAPALGQPSLVPNIAGNGSVRLTNSASQNITVPNGSDLNATTGPWTQKSFEFWFKAASVPAPGTTGNNAAAGLWEQGAATRGLAIYLWRNPANANAGQADLVFNGWNNAPGDGGGVGSPWGATNNPTYARYTISTGQTYHVVAVFDGNSTIANGNLILYVNGVEVARTNNVGRLFNHTSDIQIGRGNTLIHTATVNAGNLAFFNGWLDEFTTYSTALPASRVATHYQAGISAAAAVPSAPRITGVRVQSGNIVVTWDGGAKLERSTNAPGPFFEVPGAVSPYSEPANQEHRFFRLRQ